MIGSYLSGDHVYLAMSLIMGSLWTLAATWHVVAAMLVWTRGRPLVAVAALAVPLPLGIGTLGLPVWITLVERFPRFHDIFDRMVDLMRNERFALVWGGALLLSVLPLVLSGVAFLAAVPRTSGHPRSLR